VFVHERLIDYGIPVLGSVVNDWERSTLTQVDRVLAVTEEGAESARRKHGVDAVPNYPGTDPVADRFFHKRWDFLVSVSFWDKGEEALGLRGAGQEDGEGDPPCRELEERRTGPNSCGSSEVVGWRT